MLMSVVFILLCFLVYEHVIGVCIPCFRFFLFFVRVLYARVLCFGNFTLKPFMKECYETLSMVEQLVYLKPHTSRQVHPLNEVQPLHQFFLVARNLVRGGSFIVVCEKACGYSLLVQVGRDHSRCQFLTWMCGTGFGSHSAVNFTMLVVFFRNLQHAQKQVHACIP